ncbi:lipopolysaccharide transport periplasmic protein LptA [Candidatus Methylospira mobilis]|uniref:Lipopolysaccharide transport periplasmic protein LptA n=1 Tax=Candidatus Methylospira mobilis TaxID=1808979 RepID=A0A5Q0BM65_9GAMM|nr:lipopolysaccharide transport periplasmic protein LptA [Candidatus Methylospira mobilis]QFY43314.1 lipopolysaccharide transport periplasmic protein LptA [Candidatus Methylospira mobilis]WNV03477.1 lipopolysaccharide transport periplasmic protein LptA [Candidatus Methylospira mobilis]
MKYNKYLSISGLTLALCAVNCFALETDGKQPIYIEADNAVYDEKKELTIYTGNVHYQQGSIESWSDRMEVFQKDGKTDKVINFGNPTRLKQTPEPDKADWHGLGLRSEYYPETRILILFDKALAWQGVTPEKSDRVTSDRIEYDIEHSIMKAGVTTKSGEAPPSSQRVHVTLEPSEVKEAK